MAFNFGNPQSTSLFGQPQSTPSLFGQPQQQPSQSLFGQAQSTPALFGQAQPQSTPSLFGQPQAQSAPSLFGQPQAQSTPSLFGQPQAQSTPSLFGQVHSTPSLFGQQPPQTTQSLFGQQQSPPSLFGQTNQQQSAPSLFLGAGQSQSALNYGVNNPSLDPNAANPINTPLLMPPPQQAQFTQLPASVTQIIDRLNPSHPSTPFQAALYNVVPPSVIEQYTKPAAMHSALWHAAQSANPNPSCQVPVHANGIDDLLLRAQTQSTRVQDHAAVLQRLRKEIADIQTDVASELYTKLSAYRRRHRELARKLLRIAASVDVNAARAELHHQNQQHISIGLSALETERRKKLENTVNTLTKPAELKDKLYDLVELAPIVKGIGNSSAPVTIRDRRAADAVRGLLSDQLEGIQQLGIVCSKIERDMSIMARHEQDPVR